MDENRINYLVRQYATNQATDDEIEQLFEWLRLNEKDEVLQMQLEEMASSTSPDASYDPMYWEPVISQILRTERTPVRSIGKRWVRYAAAVILIVGVGGTAFFLINKSKTEKPVASNVKTNNDLPPGKDGAILTLSDGSKVLLDSIGNGVLSTQGSATVSIHNSSVIYKDDATTNDAVYNTMSTPNGRQYQLVLPDGSKVWLNAASSITYPTAFKGKERNVTITGEAYFEIAKDHTKPFHVKVNDMDVQVLGTRFNINSYGDESQINTTLLDGGVKVSRNQQVCVLKPGQQASMDNSELKVVNNVNLDQVMAWKNGLFDFEHAGLKSVVSQLARWYDLDVKYEGTISQRTFRGKITRDLSLMQVLAILKDVEVNFKVEGRTLVVTN
ncbi:FecR family protein [Pinibacter aurantiacus]|uniref:FecR domain-containing protein n=1 Tax=Pinibacter aurantiacus TaxID=2851599 RepID=A0A9E2W969_9BACT|nr:FecR family protein [Pinibacter aurantiacus]MBV4359252.1 FecR domain-containing protein [Pinibacter aurantiacus]